VLALAAAAFAQRGTAPRISPAEYPVHAVDGTTGIGAEYMVHSFSRGDLTYLAKDYLVVEAALFPPKDQSLEVRYADFILRINGRKQVLLPQPAEMVAMSLSHPDWRTEPHLEMAGGLGDHTLIYGAPPPSRVPNDPRPQGPPLPRVPQDDPSGIDHPAPMRPEELVVEAALPEGIRNRAVSGFLYFAYTGRPAAIKTLELIYKSAVLKLK